MPIRQKHLLSIYISAIPCPVAAMGRRRALTCRRQVVFREPTSIAATGCKRIKKRGQPEKLSSFCMWNED